MDSLRVGGYYLLFGALHELAHVVTYECLGGGGILERIGKVSDIISIGVGIVFGRCYSVDTTAASEISIRITRHAGWLFSLCLAIALQLVQRNEIKSSDNRTVSPATIAHVVCLEALVTDLLGWIPQSHGAFFCGNFGLILLNNSWVSCDGGKTALDVMQAMIHNTMIRGAQCGGVVTYRKTRVTGSHSHKPVLKGVRCRTVNDKRSDLSLKIRRALEHSVCRAGDKKLQGYDMDGDLVRAFYGHTRFATSSKANFDGCHPHQWTPTSHRRVYHPFVAHATAQGGFLRSASQSVLRNVPVSNYVTHNGDLDFFQINGKTYDLGTIQKWLPLATGAPMPTSVDSAAIAGLVDLIRTQGCFGLSCRFAICFALSTSKMETESVEPWPSYGQYEVLGKIFEEALASMLKPQDRSKNSKRLTIHEIGTSRLYRQDLCDLVLTKSLLAEFATNSENTSEMTSSFRTARMHESDAQDNQIRTAFISIARFLDAEKGAGLQAFVHATVEAFFDNDLLFTTSYFLKHAKGSFGLCITSSLDAHRQVCLAARGQPMSVAFYPRKGVVCYGSEQASVKAFMNVKTPGGLLLPNYDDPKANETLRLDLDDLGGEVCLLDWGYAVHSQDHIHPMDMTYHPITPSGKQVIDFSRMAVSRPHRKLPIHTLMDGGKLKLVLLHQNAAITSRKLWQRMTLLEGNELIRPLMIDSHDPILKDIQDIPRVCAAIQDNWRDLSLNRLTAWHLQQCLQKRLDEIISGKIKRRKGSIDVLVTGCEVSLWVGEQFASDLQKAFPRLFVQATSSNKLLGLFGQELSIPCVGYPMSEDTHDMNDVIVIIVSHSGGTFAPLACSNLLQSMTKNIFVVSSEWDTQIGKQLRSIHSNKEIISSRIFSTDVGVRPAEPCSVSVAATHQLLTQLFQHISLTILSNPDYRRATGAVITDYDLQVLETLNRDNIYALEDIVGMDCTCHKQDSQANSELRRVGDIWSEHILEQAKAYLMSFIYIVITVTTGYPLISGIAITSGMTTDWAFYITRFLDSLIYFWLPQINILILRLIQGRNLRHRMVGRTVVIGDVPWVSQAAEAFLSKIFACSYSIAGLNVLSGNPADHLVHRHTHRIVRGTLLVCGRPDGRLSALTSLESAVCLTVSQASSIQSMSATCETLTIGHNPFKLPLAAHTITLGAHRPRFLCEAFLDNIDCKEPLDHVRVKGDVTELEDEDDTVTSHEHRRDALKKSASSREPSMTKVKRRHSRLSDAGSQVSTSQILGAYTDLQASWAGRDPNSHAIDSAIKHQTSSEAHATSVQSIVNDMINGTTELLRLQKLFQDINKSGNGRLTCGEFVAACRRCDPIFPTEAAKRMFWEADMDLNEVLDFDQFVQLVKMPEAKVLSMLHERSRCDRGLLVVQANKEPYFGYNLDKYISTENQHATKFAMIKSQHFAMQLYESRIASLQRFVSMTVMFHQIGWRVQNFFVRISFGLWGYRMDRSHSMLRIATTASPVSGADVRDRMETLKLMTTVNQSVGKIQRAWLHYRQCNMRKDSLESIARKLRTSSFDSFKSCQLPKHIIV